MGTRPLKITGKHAGQQLRPRIDLCRACGGSWLALLLPAANGGGSGLNQPNDVGITAKVDAVPSSCLCSVPDFLLASARDLLHHPIGYPNHRAVLYHETLLRW